MKVDEGFLDLAFVDVLANLFLFFCASNLI